MPYIYNITKTILSLTTALTLPQIWLLSFFIITASFTSISILNKKRYKQLRIFFFSLTAISWLYAAAAITICYIGIMHGMYQTNLTCNKIIHGIDTSPIETKLPENTDNLKNAIIIYYRFGCEDCEAIYTELKQMLDNQPNIYWISSRSKQGKMLQKEYPISVVPTGVYVKNNKKPITLPLYTKQSILNKENINALLTMQQENK